MHGVPLLFVHGMCSTGAVWEKFEAFFQTRGFPTYTPTLFPELRTRAKASERLRELRFEDFVEALEVQIEAIHAATGHPPIAIGHSMGGLLVQALAERGRLRAAVFISPSPPACSRTLEFRLVHRGFRILTASTPFFRRAIYPEPALVSLLVHNRMPRAERRGAQESMVCESPAAFADLFTREVDERAIRVPTLTVGGKKDRLVSIRAVRRTAKKYERVGGKYLEYANHGHWMYQEPGWERPAQDIYDWILAHALVDVPVEPGEAARGGQIAASGGD